MSKQNQSDLTNDEQMLSFDEQLDKLLDSFYDAAKDDHIGEEYGFLLSDAKEQIEQLVLELIGDDDKWVRGSTQNPDNPMYHTKAARSRNELRAELRNKLKENE